MMNEAMIKADIKYYKECYEDEPCVDFLEEIEHLKGLLELVRC